MSLNLVLAATIKWALFILAFGLGIAGILTWVERKMSAVIQDRIGPNRASIMGFTLLGLLHPLADAIKSFTKEDFVPDGANRLMFFLAPMIALIPVMIAFAVIPFGPGDNLVIANMDSGIIALLAITSFGVYGAVLGGWSSNNAFAMLGSLRAAAQMISYEVSMGLNLVGMFMIFGTMSFSTMVYAQGHLIWGWLPAWGIVVQPLGFILFVAASLAENKRAPFDLPEGESEIIGYNVEYSSMRFATFFLSEFFEVVLISALITVLFLGGWQIPWLDPKGIAGGWIRVMQVGSFIVKTLFTIWVLMLARWTLPRFRYDQVMKLGWKVILPLSLLNIFVTAIVLAIL